MKNSKKFLTKENIFLTTTQAAKLLSISLKTLKKFIFQGKIKTFTTPGGHHRILKEDLLENLDSSSSNQKKNINNINSDKSSLFEITCKFIEIIESRQSFCRGHGSFVSDISVRLAKKFMFSKLDIEKIAKAALVHDIGMINIPERILNKEIRLTSKDYDQVKNHPLIGANILSRLSYFEDSVSIVEQHHERLDGTGYPRGIKGRNICLEAKIIGVAETFCSMTAKDTYKKPLSVNEAIRQINKSAGSKFDVKVVNALTQCVEEY